MTRPAGLLWAALLATAACTGPENPGASVDAGTEMDEAGISGTDGPALRLVDDHGDTLRLPGPATRVICLVPAMTEALVRMGAADVLVGRTEYDTLAAVADLPSVGGGLGPNLEVLRTLEPQVVVTFAGQSDPRTSAGLRSFSIPEFAVRPDAVADVPRLVEALGRLTGHVDGANRLVREIRDTLAALDEAVAGRTPVRAAYLLGGSPPLAAGPGTFLADLLELGGGENLLADLPELYAPVSPEVLRSRPLEVILVSEGSVLEPRLVGDVRVATVPNWVELPGPRIGEAAWVVARALRPGLGLETTATEGPLGPGSSGSPSTGSPSPGGG